MSLSARQSRNTAPCPEHAARILDGSAVGALFLLILFCAEVVTGEPSLFPTDPREARIVHITCRLADLYRRQVIPGEMYVHLFVIRERAWEAYWQWETDRTPARAAKLRDAMNALEHEIKEVIE